MASIKKALLFFLLGGLFFIEGCKKVDLELESTELGIDPIQHPDVFVKLLQTRGRYYDKPMPQGGDTSFGFLPFDYPDVIDFQKTVEIPISFRIQNLNNLFTVDSVFFSIDGSFGHWAVPFTRSANVVTFRVLIPNTIRNGEFCLQFKALIKAAGNRFFTKPGKVCFINPPPVFCGDTLYGRVVVTPILSIRKMILSDKKGPIIFNWGSGTNADRFDVKWNNKFVVSSGTLLEPGQVPRCTSDGFIITGFRRTKDYEWTEYDPSISREITIFCHKGCGDGSTEWRFIAKCP